MKKFVIAFTVVAFALLASTAQADLVKSYEQAGFNQTNNDLTYFFLPNDDLGLPAYGVTNKSYSLGISLPGGTWYTWIGTDWDAPDDSGQSMGQLFAQHSQIKLDVTLLNTGSGGWSDWVNVEANIQGDGLGWTGLGNQTAYPAAPGDLTATTTTLTWDYSGVNFSNVSLNPSWWQLVWNIQSPDAARMMIIDNLRLEGPAMVPEPATIVLLVMGGLMLLIRRKR